jgi:hypothetical protein
MATDTRKMVMSSDAMRVPQFECGEKRDKSRAFLAYAPMSA